MEWTVCKFIHESIPRLITRLHDSRSESKIGDSTQFFFRPVIDFDKMKRDRLDKKCVQEFSKQKLFFEI